MLVTGVWDEMCWSQLYDVGDGFGHFGRQHPPSFYISNGHQHSKDVINIEIQSPTSTDGHQLQVTNITITNQYHFENFYLTVEELKKEKLSSEETYLMLESRLVDLFNVKVS